MFLTYTSGVQERPTGWRIVLKPEYRLTLTLALGVLIFQQIGGINAITYYSADIFTSAGIQSPVLAALANGAVNLLFTMLAAALMDHCGRKTLWVTSHAGCAVSIAILAAAIAWKGAPASILLAALACALYRWLLPLQVKAACLVLK
jgi:Sugar (and other) transporter